MSFKPFTSSLFCFFSFHQTSSYIQLNFLHILFLLHFLLFLNTQGEDLGDIRRGLTLGYSYFDVDDEVGEIVGRVNVWEIPHEVHLKLSLEKKKKVFVITTHSHSTE
jgi:hypothetical protein